MSSIATATATATATTTTTKPSSTSCSFECTQKIFLKYHLPIGLTLGLLIGYIAPASGITWSSIIPKNDWIKMSNINVFFIFLLSGLKLQTKDVRKALVAWKAVLYGLFIILLFTPLFSFGLVNLPFQTSELAYGLAIFFLGPTTISSGVILTGQAKGNIALGLMLTITTNLLAILTMPLSLTLVFGSVDGISVSIDAGILLAKLLMYILLPLLIGKCINHLLACTTPCTKRFKTPLKLLSSFLLIMVPWMSVSKSANKFNALSAGEIIAVFAIGIGLHLIFLFITYALFRRSCWKLPLAERKAAVILSSQKTLPVALSVISFLPLALGAHGLMALPCIISHFCQIVMDGFVAASWAEVVDDKEQDKELVDSKYSTTELENVEVVVGKKEEAVNNM